MDTTTHIYYLLIVSSDLLGEVQFSFVCFLIGHGKLYVYTLHHTILCHYIRSLHHTQYMSLLPLHTVYEAFEQWKKLIWLLCSCEEAITTHHDLYTSFIGKISDLQFL